MRQTERLAADAAGLARAADILRGGGLVAFPTETVYGLGADATDAEAVAGIYAAKERPSFNPLISHLDSFESARVQGLFDETATRLAQAFWPGPLTLVVPVAPTCTVSDLARAGLDSVGLRVPAHPLAHALLERTGRPVAAPSANRSGRISPTDADHVLGDLDGRIDAVLDGGAAQVGVESTIVSCLDGTPRLLRPGGIPREAIEALIGKKLEMGAETLGASPLAPGMLASHYAPRAQVRLNATGIRPGEAALLFGPGGAQGAETARATLNLSENGDLVEAAAHLFSYLRQLDASGAATIAVGPIPETGLGEAINDRLRRAAAER
ncbi:L-threonylcarbamoyladenylate synthase [Microvirga mediterraneensis]|uniref:Threonylcarbamoyl-AMP synthase n=1 Tax=Microvirga mediterraneensis TaxID=2754695 RepID=A0A838BT93_9HYPH|nr:L-threonylcarbamoyladenylate synthase [Microvirga mediterraneensis]MBA1158269.1 threonylcarbamoyl-AMP synthase [Microvirga mediterraneensis]